MKNKTMRIAFMLCLFVALLPARAQSDLQTGIVFERFGKAKNCKMVVLNDAVLRGYKLKVYKALTYKKIGASIAPYLNIDRKKARKIRDSPRAAAVASRKGCSCRWEESRIVRAFF